MSSEENPSAPIVADNTPVHTPTADADNSNNESILTKNEKLNDTSNEHSEHNKPLSPPLPSPKIPTDDDSASNMKSEHQDFDSEDLNITTKEADSNDPLNSQKRTNDDDEGSTEIEPETKKQRLEEDEETGQEPEVKHAQDVNLQAGSSASSLPTIPAPKPPLEPDMNNLPENPMPKHQAKHASTTIKAVRRLKDAGPFLAPVDIVKLNIPFYYNYIPRPMDLGTIEKKLTCNAYETPEQVVSDFNLMVANCCKFNGNESAISQMARNIQASFEKHMLNMPPKDLPPNTVVPTSKGRRKNTNAAPAIDVAGVPIIRRESATNDGRPKREIHPPKPKDMPYDIRPRKKKYATELRFCNQVIKELTSKKYESFNFPFLEPVDPVALDCPTYFDIVKEPMDLGTIQTKLSNNLYENGDEFEEDVRLVFFNCYAFNPEGTPVNMMGHRLETIFDKKWSEKPVVPSTPPQLSSDESEEESEVEIDESTVTNPNIQYLELQLARMQKELEQLKKDEVEKLKKQKLKKKKQKKTKSRKHNSRDDDSSSTIVTFEMKKELSDKLQLVNEKKLGEVVEIIKKSVDLSTQNDEIELDMDVLDNSTLLKLYHFVVKKDKKQANGSKRGSNVNNGSSKKRKQKTLTDAEQSKQIEDLKKRLEEFDTLNSGSKMDDNESSSDDDESESSEEE